MQLPILDCKLVNWMYESRKDGILLCTELGQIAKCVDTCRKCNRVNRMWLN